MKIDNNSIKKLIEWFTSALVQYKNNNGTSDEIFKQTFSFYKNGLSNIQAHLMLDGVPMDYNDKLTVVDMILDFYNIMKTQKNDKKLKEIIKECIEEILRENEGYKIATQERTKINNKFHSKGELGGTIKLDKKEKALTTINLILNEFGFELDMVTGDILMGEKGSRLLTFRKKTPSEDPFTEGPEVTNSKISFNWENMERPQMESNKFPRWEVVAYVT